MLQVVLVRHNIIEGLVGKHFHGVYDLIDCSYDLYF